MADKSDYTAKIRAKGLSSTGVTEELAKQFYHQLGSHHLFIVEGRVDRRSENGDGTHTTELILTQVEPSKSQAFDDHLRELMRANARDRALAEGAIPETLGTTPDLQDVIKGSGEAILIRDSEGNPDGIWNGDTDPEAAAMAQKVVGGLGALGEAMADAGPSEVQDAMATVKDLAASGTCVFPGCRLPFEHEGDHDIFREPKGGKSKPAALAAVPDKG